ncbi:MAG: PQQ-dependent sugar dehydrogenase [Candidatus Neomarinimicrobiota bacterium]
MPSASISQVQVELAFPNLNFQKPLDLQHPPDGSNRLFVVEKSGMIYVFENDPNVMEKKVFLDIRDSVFDAAPEAGLLGLAFHPDHMNNGYFYVNYTNVRPGNEDSMYTIVSRFSVSDNDQNSADAESEVTIIRIQQPLEHHNGGQIIFGPDGYFYIGMGDGGLGGNGQNLETLLGALLRIDVDNPQGDYNYGIPEDNPFADSSMGREIFAYGFRNPWRFSFDAITGSIWLGDVGHVRYEEIDIVVAGQNYGWDIVEGAHCYDRYRPSSSPTGCDTTGLTMPVWEYGRSLGEAIIGGFVYRGSQIPSLYGKYIYGDFEFGTVWSLDYNGIDPPTSSELFQMGPWSVTSFGVDKDNELYICTFNGKIYRMERASQPAEPFDLIFPYDSTTIEITQDNFWTDTLYFAWEESGYPVTYSFVLTEGLSIFNFGESTINTRKVPYYQIKNVMYSAGVEIVTGTWTVVASDGIVKREGGNGPFTLTIDGSGVSVERTDLIPGVFALHQNHPNPFNPVTTLQYDLPERSEVVLTIYDILGRVVRTLVQGMEQPGYKSVTWDGTDDRGEMGSGGVYLYQIRIGDFTQTRKMALLR